MGREQRRDAQDETLTSAPPSPAPSQAVRPQKADRLKRCHLNNRSGRGRQPDRETGGASRRLLSPAPSSQLVHQQGSLLGHMLYVLLQLPLGGAGARTAPGRGRRGPGGKGGEAGGEEGGPLARVGCQKRERG